MIIARVALTRVCCAHPPQMVNQLQRLGLPQTSSLEQKRLALDLAALVIAWEKRRRSASAAKPAVGWTGTQQSATSRLQMRPCAGRRCVNSLKRL